MARNQPERLAQRRSAAAGGCRARRQTLANVSSRQCTTAGRVARMRLVARIDDRVRHAAGG